MHITVIVSTYNWPQALECVLRSFMVQSAADFEVVVADDWFRFGYAFYD